MKASRQGDVVRPALHVERGWLRALRFAGSDRPARSSPMLRPPFVAGPHFARDLAFVWGREPVCCYCGHPIQARKVLAWGRAYRPESLHHLGYRPERAGTDGL